MSLKTYLNACFVSPAVKSWSLQKEILAGLVNFLTAAYIIAVNPQILSETGMPEAALIAATCYATAFGCLLMALWPKVPIMMAPAMGVNAFFAYTLCVQMQIPWPHALGLIFLSGILFFLLTIGKLREHILEAIPLNLRLSIAVGIGFFIVFIGFRSMGLIVPHASTFVTLGPITPSLLLALLGLTLAIILERFKVPGALLGVIIGITIIAVLLGWVEAPAQWISHPPSVAPIAMQLDLLGALQPAYWGAILALLYVMLFDSMGTFTGLAYQMGLRTKTDKIPRLNQMLKADAVSTSVGAALGTSPLTPYVESGAGVTMGGKTGWTAFFTGLLFLGALFFTDVIMVIPAYATAIALVVVGLHMIRHLQEINFSDWEDAVPAFFTIMLMPLTYSIATGFCFGVLIHTVLQLGVGQWRQISPTLAIMASVSLLYLLFAAHV